MAIDAPLASELLQQLQSADRWLRLLVDQCDLEPEETAFVVDVVEKDGARKAVARITLAHSMSQIAAAVEAGKAAVDAGHA